MTEEKRGAEMSAEERLKSVQRAEGEASPAGENVHGAPNDGLSEDMDEKTPVDAVPPEAAVPSESAEEKKRDAEELALLHGTPAGEEAEDALLRLKAATLLEDLYDARQRILESFDSLKKEMGSEKERLEQQAQIFIRSVENARKLGAALRRRRRTRKRPERHSPHRQRMRRLRR